MSNQRRILIVGGGTAGWLTAAYLARALRLAARTDLQVTVLESPEIGVIGVGEGTFPTLRGTLQFLGIDERQFMRDTGATFKQGIRFQDWAHAPGPGGRHVFFHPFEAPWYDEQVNLVPYWLLQDRATRAPFAQAVTLQARVAAASRAPRRLHEPPYAAPLNYAYHFDAVKLARLLAAQARGQGVRHVHATLSQVVLDETGAVGHVETLQHGRFDADLYVDCTGFRAELIRRVPGDGWTSTRPHLFVDRAIACKRPDAPADAAAPLESCTVATAHEAGWTWDIALDGARGLGCVYSSDHLDDAGAEAILRAQLGPGHEDVALRPLAFPTGYRTRPWRRNCVAIGLSSGFLEPLEATGIVLIEAAVAMLAEMLPHAGPIDAPARRFNELMAARQDGIVQFLKLHYTLSRREEPFWREHAERSSVPDRLAELLEQWRARPPGRYDFSLDTETFAFFNYQYILYGMGYDTDLSAARADFPAVEEAARLFAKVRRLGDRAMEDLPAHRALVQHVRTSAR